MFSLGTILSNSTQSKNLQVKGELLFFLGSCPLIFDHHKMRYIVCHQVRPRETANTPSFAMPPERPFLVCTETFCTWMILPSQVIHYKLREFSFRPTWEVLVHIQVLDHIQELSLAFQLPDINNTCVSMQCHHM